MHNELTALSASGAAHKNTASDKFRPCPREVLLNSDSHFVVLQEYMT